MKNGSLIPDLRLKILQKCRNVKKTNKFATEKIEYSFAGVAQG
jgi:hypothetical protein